MKGSVDEVLEIWLKLKVKAATIHAGNGGK